MGKDWGHTLVRNPFASCVPGSRIHKEHQRKCLQSQKAFLDQGDEYPLRNWPQIMMYICSILHTEGQIGKSLGQILEDLAESSKGMRVWSPRYRMRNTIVWSLSFCRDNALHERKKSQGTHPMPLFPVSERGGDLGSLRIKVKICSMEQMMRGNTEKETGAKMNGRQSKLIISGEVLLVHKALYILVKLFDANCRLEKLERK